MSTTVTLAHSDVGVVNGLGIVRCVEKKQNDDGKIHGHAEVWYDVCLEESFGDIIESFKRKSQAVAFAKNYRLEV